MYGVICISFPYWIAPHNTGHFACGLDTAKEIAKMPGYDGFNSINVPALVCVRQRSYYTVTFRGALFTDGSQNTHYIRKSQKYTNSKQDLDQGLAPDSYLKPDATIAERSAVVFTFSSRQYCRHRRSTKQDKAI